MSTLLPRFVLTASLARLVSEGFALALVLLTLERSGSTAAAGWLIAVATLPQLATGPLLGPLLDRATHPWRVLRAAAAVTALATLVMAVSVDRWPFVVPAAAALAMACTEPLLTGGVSATGGRGPWAARVYAWDSLAYNLAGLAGPAVVTVVALAASPAWALAALAVAGGALTVTSLGLGVTTASEHVPAGGRLGTAVRLIASAPPLRSATVATTLAFAALGGLSFAVVSATQALGRPAADAGAVMTVAAVGGLAGSLAMTRRLPPRRPSSTVLVSLTAMGVALAVMGLGSWPLLLAGAFVIGFIDGPLLVGLFTARSDHSPPALRATVFTVTASAKLGAASLGAVVAAQALDGRATGAGLVAIGTAHVVAAGAGRLSEVRRPGRRRAPGTCPSRRPQAAPRRT